MPGQNVPNLPGPNPDIKSILKKIFEQPGITGLEVLRQLAKVQGFKKLTFEELEALINNEPPKELKSNLDMLKQVLKYLKENYGAKKMEEIERVFSLITQKFATFDSIKDSQTYRDFELLKSAGIISPSFDSSTLKARFGYQKENETIEDILAGKNEVAAEFRRSPDFLHAVEVKLQDSSLLVDDRPKLEIIKRTCQNASLLDLYDDGIEQIKKCITDSNQTDPAINSIKKFVKHPTDVLKKNIESTMKKTNPPPSQAFEEAYVHYKTLENLQSSRNELMGQIQDLSVSFRPVRVVSGFSLVAQVSPKKGTSGESVQQYTDLPFVVDSKKALELKRGEATLIISNASGLKFTTPEYQQPTHSGTNQPLKPTINAILKDTKTKTGIQAVVENYLINWKRGDIPKFTAQSEAEMKLLLVLLKKMVDELKKNDPDFRSFPYEELKIQVTDKTHSQHLEIKKEFLTAKGKELDISAAYHDQKGFQYLQDVTSDLGSRLVYPIKYPFIKHDIRTLLKSVEVDELVEKKNLENIGKKRHEESIYQQLEKLHSEMDAPAKPTVKYEEVKTIVQGNSNLKAKLEGMRENTSWFSWSKSPVTKEEIQELIETKPKKAR